MSSDALIRENELKERSKTMGKEIAKRKEREIQNGALPQIIQLAVEKGDLDKVEKLLILQERWEKNEARKAYHEAMANFKANPPKIGKDKKVGYKTTAGQVGYSHASLYNVTDKINSELSKHGLSASWTTKQNGGVTVTCKITHVKGHSEETTLTAQPDASGSKNSIQALGSTITYLCRYSLLCLTGLATKDQDDDGKATTVEVINDKQKGQVLDYIAETGVDIERFCKAFGIKEVEQLPKTRFKEAITALQKKAKK